MASKERFLATYNNPVNHTEVISVPVRLIGSPKADKYGKVGGPTGLGTWFMEDPRNMGGKHLITG